MLRKDSVIVIVIAIMAMLSSSVRAEVDGVKLPALVQRCTMSDVHCLMQQINNFMQHYPHGVAKLGIPDLEPLHVHAMNIVGGRGSRSSLTLNLKNITIHNFSKANVTKVSVRNFTADLRKAVTLYVHFSMAKLRLLSRYTGNGTLLMFHLVGDGDCELLGRRVQLMTKIVLMPEKRPPRGTFFNIIAYKFDAKFANVHINLTNLIGGQKEINDNLIKFLNDNWQAIADEVLPQVLAVLSAHTEAFMRDFFGRIAYEDLFLVASQGRD